MPGYDPQSYRIRIYSAVEVVDQHNAPHWTYPRLLWEEPPGQELAVEYPHRWSEAFGQADVLSREVLGHVAIALAWLFEDKPDEFQYRHNGCAPSVQVIPRGAVWVPVRQAVQS